MTPLWKVIYGVPLALDAIITDFDGVVVDSEPLHMDAFAQTVAPLGITFTKEAYYQRYLGFDDHDGCIAILHDNGMETPEDLIAKLEADKAVIMKQLIAEKITPLPGTVAFFSAAKAAGVPLAICSGAIRQEIDQCNAAIGLNGTFPVIVAAKDVRFGKPDPEGYIIAREKLSTHLGRELRPEKCVAFEDSPAGLDAAKDAGLFVIGVTSSHNPDTLSRADQVITDLSQVCLEQITQWLSGE